jgi:hypothetical protein
MEVWACLFLCPFPSTVDTCQVCVGEVWVGEGSSVLWSLEGQ